MITLGKEQQDAVEDAVKGHNLFITGGGGVGKSVVIETIVKMLKEKGKKVAICASTGIAAVNVGGQTIHSLLGLGTTSSMEELRPRLRYLDLDRTRQRLQNLDTIIIDEISMISGSYLDMINFMLQTIMLKGSFPFGMVQMIFVGDILQLPPILNTKTKFPYMYMSDAWNSSDFKIHYLTHVYRQEDKEMQGFLCNVRDNTNLKNALEYFNRRVKAFEDDSDATRLFSKNVDVDRVNLERLDSNSNTEYYYKADFSGDDNLIEKLKKNCMAVEDLYLKEGVPVLCLRNDFKKGIYNGMKGYVSDCSREGVTITTKKGGSYLIESVDWEFKGVDGEVLAKMNQIPLKLAFATSIHKSQGMTLDSLVFDPRGTFAPGQVYVALSRVRTYEGLSIDSPIKTEHVKVEDFLVSFDKRCMEISKNQKESDSK